MNSNSVNNRKELNIEDVDADDNADVDDNTPGLVALSPIHVHNHDHDHDTDDDDESDHDHDHDHCFDEHVSMNPSPSLSMSLPGAGAGVDGSDGSYGSYYGSDGGNDDDDDDEYSLSNTAARVRIQGIQLKRIQARLKDAVFRYPCLQQQYQSGPNHNHICDRNHHTNAS